LTQNSIKLYEIPYVDIFLMSKEPLHYFIFYVVSYELTNYKFRPTVRGYIFIQN
jgi:hypothetical protein